MGEINHTPPSKKQDGAALVDYALLVALIAVVVIASVRVIGQKVACMTGGATYALSRPNGAERTLDEYIRHVPGEFVSDSNGYIGCTNLW